MKHVFKSLIELELGVKCFVELETTTESPSEWVREDSTPNRAFVIGVDEVFLVARKKVRVVPCRYA